MECWKKFTYIDPGSNIVWNKPRMCLNSQALLLPGTLDLKVPHGHWLHQAHKHREMDKLYHFHMGKVWCRILFKVTE